MRHPRLSACVIAAVLASLFLIPARSADAWGWRHHRLRGAAAAGYACPGWYAEASTYPGYATGYGAAAGLDYTTYNYAYWGTTPGTPWYAAYPHPGPGFGYPGTPYTLPFSVPAYTTPPTTLSVW